MKTADLPGGPRVFYSWKPDGLLESVDYGGGRTRRYDYDAADRVVSVTNNFGPLQSEQFVYTYDGNSNREAN